jgi:hypothetical protein
MNTTFNGSSGMLEEFDERTGLWRIKLDTGVEPDSCELERRLIFPVNASMRIFRLLADGMFTSMTACEWSRSCPACPPTRMSFCAPERAVLGAVRKDGQDPAESPAQISARGAHTRLLPRSSADSCLQLIKEGHVAWSGVEIDEEALAALMQLPSAGDGAVLSTDIVGESEDMPEQEEGNSEFSPDAADVLLH